MEIKCVGIIERDRDGFLKVDVNYSSIFSFLIKEVGRKVNHYASDLYYDLKEIEKYINFCQDGYCLIGLREMGVDSKGAIDIKLANPNCYEINYINIYAVTVSVDMDRFEITVTLSTLK